MLFSDLLTKIGAKTGELRAERTGSYEEVVVPLAQGFTIHRRPFAVEPLTGIMRPDGIFEASLPQQTITCYLTNDTGTTVSGVTVWIKAVSDPGIVVPVAWRHIENVGVNESFLVDWPATFVGASPGKVTVTFAYMYWFEPGGGQVAAVYVGDAVHPREIQATIFVTSTLYDAASKAYVCKVPEGRLSVRITSVTGPKTLDKWRDPAVARKQGFIQRPGRSDPGHPQPLAPSPRLLSSVVAVSPLRILYVTTARYDFTTATLVQGLNALPGVELRTTNLGNYASPSQVLSRSDAIEYGRNADVLVLGYTRGCDSGVFWAVENEGPVRVLVDGGDNSELSVSLRQLPKLDAVFKREWFLEDRSMANLLRLARRVHPGIWGTIRRHPLVPFPSLVGFENKTRLKDFVRNAAVLPMLGKFHPLPYGIEERFQGAVNRTPAFELSCMVGGHLPERRAFVSNLAALRLPDAFIGEIPSGPEDTQRLVAMGAVEPSARRGVELGHNEQYYARIRDSRRSVSIPGGGFDTLRFWEILGQGALLISKRVAIEMPQPPVEGTHYLAFDSSEELREVIEQSYRRPDEADEIRANGHAFALRFHTTRARAVYVLATLVKRGLLGRDRLPAPFEPAAVS